MPKFALLCLLALVSAFPALGATAAKVSTFNPLDFGVVGDGQTNNTAAFAKVMAAVAANGGGTVNVPPGRYLTGAIHLVDNVNLHLEAGAELLYSGDPADSPVVPSRWEATNVWAHAPLVYADGKQNISITGRGTLNGQGWLWWWRSASRGLKPPPGITPKLEATAAREAWRAVYARIEAGEKLTKEDFSVAREFLRPSLVGLYNCRNVLVEGVTLFKSPMWMLHPVYSEDIVIRGVRFISADPEGKPSPEGHGPNGDGVDIDSCINVRISDCFFNTSDDCIVIKSGRDNDGLRTNRITQYITITNCIMYKGHGAVVIGSETSGGIRNITASNIVSVGTHTGIRVKSMRGRGGVMENFRFDNWVIEDSKRMALEITMRYGRSEPAPVSEKTPLFRNFNYSNITIVNAAKVATIQGLEERDVEQLRFVDLNATGKTGIIADHARDVEMHHVRVAAESGPAIAFEASSGLVLDDVSARTADQSAPAIALVDTRDSVLERHRAAAGTRTYLSVGGAKSANIKLLSGDLSAATSDVVTVSGAEASAVIRR